MNERQLEINGHIVKVATNVEIRRESDAKLGSKTITGNGTYYANTDGYDGYNQVITNVPNSYSASDEGKVVENGTLVQQTTGYINENGTFTTTKNNQIIVAVPNSYPASDEGKVVSNGALVAQTSDTVTTNDTYDTTLIKSLTVNVPSPVFSDNDFIDRYFNTSDFESNRVFNLPDIKFGGLFKARSIRLLNATGGNMYGMQYFLNFSALTQYIVLPGVTDVSVDFVKNVTSILGLDFGNNLGTIRATAFTGCTSFDTLVIRKSTGVPTLANINAFNNSCFASGKTGGTLYVPNAVLSDYTSASNWSTILGYANNQIKSIESTHTDPNAPIDLTLYYADGTPIAA